jgi:hypothetical protein
VISSGTTAIATTSDTPVQALTITGWVNNVVIQNEGTIAGFASVDGGTTWIRLPAGPCDLTLHGPFQSPSVQVKRVAAGSNLTGIWAYAEV